MTKLSFLIAGLYGLTLVSIPYQLISQSPVDITLEVPFDDTSSILFQEGNASYGMLMRYNGDNSVNGLQIIPITPDNTEKRSSLTIDRDEGWVAVGRKEEGKLLVLNSERSWAFSQIGTGAASALKLSAADPNNNNKHFIIDTDGFVGIRDDAPVHQLSLGSSLARTKLALYESNNNTSNYGLGVTSGRFHFNLGNNNARYQFNDGPGTGATAIFTIYGDGNILAPGLEGFGIGAPMIYSTNGGEIGYDNSSRRFKTNIKTLDEDWTKILETRPVTYTRPASPNAWEVGYIAEEMDSLDLGNLVGYDSDGIPFYVSYNRVTLYLTEILKIHHADLESKREEINQLRSKITDLNDLKNEVKELKEVLYAKKNSDSKKRNRKRKRSDGR